MPQRRREISVGPDIIFSVQGRYMRGWSVWYAARRREARDAWRRLWECMPECACYGIANDEQCTATVIHFALHLRKERIEANCKISRATTRVVLTLQQGILEFLADGLDRYLHTVYLPARPRHKPPPARISPKKSREVTTCSLSLAPAQRHECGSTPRQCGT